MSTLKADTIVASDGSSPATLTGQYTAKAWVNLNGTGTVAVRESGNVSSITDTGTGAYTANFASALTDANYSAGGMCNWNINGWGTVSLNASNSGNPLSTTSVNFRTLEYATSFDPTFVTMQVFR